MKKSILLLFLISLVNFSFAGEFEKDLESFNTLTVAGNFEVYLVKGEKNSAKIVNTDPELLDEQIEFIHKGAELKITTQGNSLKKMSLKIYITFVKVLNLNAKNGGWIETKDALEGDEIEISCTTDGVVHAKLACSNVKASVVTGGTIRLNGTADIAEYKVSTGGFVSGKDVIARQVTSKVSTGGDISCHGTEKMDLKVSAGGTIKYIFDGEIANFTEKVTIAGEIKKFDGK